ncbi:LytTR family DNA-binding domain-containing protein [Paucibacter sp. TC2R-5]|uniref:LytR/AlgR family response regulator transcription factor n=1 Tax=Paucibacter sp. TC2R-5 TaxID=2893555 RepID=UPI0021E406F5|nr:LytTR family DNA-binding domain-containing protein [Paucibacter sp. TC2R-5]MCV2360079.1 LytTR family DNA-binding domain-containing protein [Paucibacter sp. TC2R-5]
MSKTKQRALVIEDSRLAREGLVRMLGAFTEQIEVLGQADNAENARVLIEELRPDLLFLDIHMPGDSGFELLEKLAYTPRIVFTTAFSEHAIRSFDFNTVDYLLKPISPLRLAQAVAKLSAEPELAQTGPEAETEPKPVLDLNSKIFIKDGDHCHLLALPSILYIESCKNYVRVFFTQPAGETKSAYVKKSLNQIEERLPTQLFFRASRQHLVNLQAIKGIAESIREGFEITMIDGKRLEVSRRNAAELKELLSF